MISFARVTRHLVLALIVMLMIVAMHVFVPGASNNAQSNLQTPMPIDELAPQLRVGDVVFIRVSHLLYRKVADANASWTNHVGIVIDVTGAEPVIAESRVPRASATSLSRFLARSENGRVAIRRLPRDLTEGEQHQLTQAAKERFGQWYDLGFDLHSRRQFCSKYVREVLLQSTGEPVGEVENFAALLARHPEVDQSFWKWWYLGSIPWNRETVTPASQYESSRLNTVFDGRVMTAPAPAGHNSQTATNPT